MLKRLLFVVLMALATAANAVNYSLPWGPKPQFVDTNGAPMSSGTFQSLLAGSSTPQVTYTTATGSVANTTTMTLNTRGETPNEVWLAAGVSYKFVLKDSSGVTIWTVDNVSGVNDVTAQLGQEWIASNLTPTFVSGTSFTVAGDQTSVLHVGRRLKSTNSGGTIYSTITASAFAASTTVTVANDSGNLDAGLTGLSYGIVSANNPSVSPEMVYRKGTAVVSATSTNIWNIVGDFVHVTGTTTITSLGTAPYAGALRTVIFDGALTLTHNATTLKLPGAANITTAADDRMIVRADTTANMVVVMYMKANGRAIVTTSPTQPTQQILTSGSGTYTTPAGTTRIHVRMVGGGGGGGGTNTAGAANGSSGGNTTFSTFTASGGAGGTLGNGASTGGGGAGGGATGGNVNISGNPGGGTSASLGGNGGNGGASPFGGAAGGGQAQTQNGNAGSANSGSGGGGGAGTGAATFGAGGGGSGGYVEAWINSPAATYSYAVGALGGGGTGNGQANGGNGGSGLIIVEEAYD